MIFLEDDEDRKVDVDAFIGGLHTATEIDDERYGGAEIALLSARQAEMSPCNRVVLVNCGHVGEVR